MSGVTEDLAGRRAGKKLVQLSFMRATDSRVPPTVRLLIQDEDMKIETLLDMSPNDWVNIESGLSTWVADGLAQ